MTKPAGKRASEFPKWFLLAAIVGWIAAGLVVVFGQSPPLQRVTWNISPYQIGGLFTYNVANPEPSNFDLRYHDPYVDASFSYGLVRFNVRTGEVSPISVCRGGGVEPSPWIFQIVGDTHQAVNGWAISGTQALVYANIPGNGACIQACAVYGGNSVSCPPACPKIKDYVLMGLNGSQWSYISTGPDLTAYSPALQDEMTRMFRGDPLAANSGTIDGFRYAVNVPLTNSTTVVLDRIDSQPTPTPGGPTWTPTTTFTPAGPTPVSSVTPTPTPSICLPGPIVPIGGPNPGCTDGCQSQPCPSTTPVSNTPTPTVTPSVRPTTTPTAAVGPCGPVSPYVLCLRGRFALSVTFGGTSKAVAVPLTESDGGYFWFFEASNPEVFVKVLDGCQINLAVWFFAAGMTDVQTAIRVEDVVTGAVNLYAQPPKTKFVTITDTAAFEGSCP